MRKGGPSRPSPAAATAPAATAAATDDPSAATPKLYAVQVGYSAYKPDTKTNRVRRPLVILYHQAQAQGSDAVHPAVVFATALTQAALPSKTVVLVVDLSPLVPVDTVAALEEWMDEEGASTLLEKKVSKPTCRLLEKLFLQEATVAAYGPCCQLLLKVVALSAGADAGHRLTADHVAKLVFLHPTLPAKCINAQFRGPPSPVAAAIKVHVVFASEADLDRRLAVLRAFFPQSAGSVCPIAGSPGSTVLAYLRTSAPGPATPATEAPGTAEALESRVWAEFDPDWTNEMGEGVWLADVQVVMNKFTKQYEQFASDATRDVHESFDAARKARRKAAALAAVGSQATAQPGKDGAGVGAGAEVGGLVLRGSRCVLVRSVEGHWPGMRIPSLPPLASDASPEATAVRAVATLCDIDDDEYYVLAAVPPVKIYPPAAAAGAGSGSGPGATAGPGQGEVTVYLMYAVQPPPDGPLEDQDQEDVDDPYDWYTWPRALRVLADGCSADGDDDDDGDDDSKGGGDDRKPSGDSGSGSGSGGGGGGLRMRLALQTIACALAAAAEAGHVPRKWGGVFGHEYMDAVDASGVFATPGGRQPQQQSLRRLTNPTAQQPGAAASASTGRALPVTIVGGAYGAGKTTLIKHLLATQTTCARVAVVVNTLADVNHDVALLTQGTGDGGRDGGCGPGGAAAAAAAVVSEVNSACACCPVASVSLSLSLSPPPPPLLAELLRLAAAGDCDHCIVEASATADLAALAASLAAAAAAAAGGGDAGGRFYVDTVVLVVDGASGGATGGPCLGHWRQQAAAADVIAITHTDTTPAAPADGLAATLAAANPRAEVVVAPLGQIDPSLALHTRRYRPATLDAKGSHGVPGRPHHHHPAAAVTFRAHRPFHPARLHACLRTLLPPTAPAHASAPPPASAVAVAAAQVVRVKGIAWLAPYADNQCWLSCTRGRGAAGSVLGAPWWASVPRAEWPAGLGEAIAPLWRDPHGDRQIELVVIAEAAEAAEAAEVGGGDGAARKHAEDAVALLATCLVTDAEYAAGQDAWNELDDPFDYAY